MKPYEEILCAGTHYEMGVQQGAWLKPRFEALFADLVNNPLTPKWVRFVGPRILKTFVAIKGVSVREHHLEHMKKSAPAQVERIQGIAEGAGLSLPVLLGLGSIETRAAHFQYILGCSSLGLASSRCFTDLL